MLIEKRQILLIDDELTKCETFLKALEKTPSMFKCSFVSNISEALIYAKKNDPDFIFVDMSEPDQNALLCLDAIKKERHIQHIPCFLYADNFNKETIKKAVALGASKCIRKPKDVRTLIRMLKSLFYQSRRAEIRNYAPRKNE